MPHTKYITAIVLLSAGALFAGRQIQFRDIWSLKPVQHVRVIVNNDTLFSDSRGMIRVNSGWAANIPLEVFKAGYFKERIDASQRLVWLTPLNEAGEIVASGKSLRSAALGLPAHVSRIEPNTASAGVDANLGALLKAAGGIQVKSYGATGQLQTVSVRGMSASQTQVSLDGVPLNNLQLGSVDLGLLDLNALGDVFLYRGGSLYLGGSGAIGGALNIHSAELLNRFAYRLFYQRAPWGNEAFGGHVQLPFSGIRQQISWFRGYGQNNYSAGKADQTVRMQNRDFSRWNGQYQAEYDFSEALTASVFFLQTKNDRGAPKPFTSAQAEAANLARLDTDQNLSKVKLSYAGQTGGVTLQVYGRNEWMRYDDPAVIMNNRVLHSLHFNQELGVQLRGRYRPFNQFKVLAGSEAALYKVKSTNAGRHRRSLQSAYVLGIYDYSFDHHLIQSLQFRPGLRLERESSGAPVWLPGMGVSLQGEGGEVYASAGKNFRRPTLNDLYWIPGGNPELRAETSWNYETGAKYMRPLGAFLWQTQAALFRNEVRDQIKWQPVGGLWQPQNISAVLSEGVELSVEIAHNSNRHSIRATYSFGIAEKQRPDSPQDQTAGNQLPYTPREHYTVQIQSGYGPADGGLLFTGSSFAYVGIANDPADIIPAVHTLDVWLSLSGSVREQHLRVKAALLNAFNSRYEVVKGYPMPPREFRVSLEIEH